MNQHRKELTSTERKQLVKTLDLAIGVRVPASQPHRNQTPFIFFGKKLDLLFVFFLEFKLKLAKVALCSGRITPRHGLFHLRDLTP